MSQKQREGFSFNEDEVNAATQLFRALRRGGDVKTLLRSDALRSFERKFIARAETRANENLNRNLPPIA